ncbi:heparinase [Mesobaculum littorinae]|uniref:Heparinase n=1 Tax=Mesobaculum littorinae TaxID=2486419 RepID=A0A438AGF0_9RHOB|nr:heparinase II/III family protein [Mesobaculum littorinae]RVV97789.1 heparinase [Mesobaculum littorinae]
MNERESWSAKRNRLMDRWQARLALLARTPGGFVAMPEPISIGRAQRGHDLARGQFLFAGTLVEAPGTAPWDLPSPGPRFDAELHAFLWLDDLAAATGAAPAQRMRDWTHDWVRRYGGGTGPGWRPELAGRRLIRFLHHADTLGRAATPVQRDRLALALGRHVRFLSRRGAAAPAGLPRIEAMTALLLASLALTGLDRHVAQAQKWLARDCSGHLDGAGGIVSRNPEELLAIFAHLAWAAAALEAAGRRPGQAHGQALARIAPLLRALRHGDGGLARFHGGGAGLEGRLDRALASAAPYLRRNEVQVPSQPMGFARLSHGRTTLILDAASPPQGASSANAHASTLAFELTSGRRPLIVSCGSGAPFGEKWRRAGRATASHSTLAIEGYSSSRLGPGGLASGERAELLLDVPRDVRLERRMSDRSSGLIAGHDGYIATHGLTHVRQLHLGIDGRSLDGEDVLATVERADEARFDRALDDSGYDGIPFRLRFHLHPDVEAEMDADGTAAILTLKSGEVWRLRHRGQAAMTIEGSVYLQVGRLAPRATKQVVLSSAAREYATRVSWSLAKDDATPDVVRDLHRDDGLALTDLT